MECTGDNCNIQPADGYYYCHNCTVKLEQELAEVDSVWEDVIISKTRRDKGAPPLGGTGHSTSSPPINLGTIDPADQLKTVLRGWAEQLSVVNPAYGPVRVSSQLIHQIDALRRKPWMADFHHELQDALRQCRRMVDRREQRVFAGICPTETDGVHCNTAVFVHNGHTNARCTTCTAEWDVSEWRARALAYANMTSWTPVQLSRMISDPTSGETVPFKKIHDWIYEKRLQPTGERNGSKVYALGDVRNLWDKYRAKRTPVSVSH